MMKTIETTIEVDAQHRATLQLPEDVGPGQYRITLILDGVAVPWEGYPTHDIPWPWPEDYTFRREDMYGDDGR